MLCGFYHNFFFKDIKGEARPFWFVLTFCSVQPLCNASCFLLNCKKNTAKWDWFARHPSFTWPQISYPITCHATYHSLQSHGWCIFLKAYLTCYWKITQNVRDIIQNKKWNPTNSLITLLLTQSITGVVWFLSDLYCKYTGKKAFFEDTLKWLTQSH